MNSSHSKVTFIDDAESKGSEESEETGNSEENEQSSLLEKEATAEDQDEKPKKHNVVKKIKAFALLQWGLLVSKMTVSLQETKAESDKIFLFFSLFHSRCVRSHRC